MYLNTSERIPVGWMKFKYIERTIKSICQTALKIDAIWRNTQLVTSGNGAIISMYLNTSNVFRLDELNLNI